MEFTFLKDFIIFRSFKFIERSKFLPILLKSVRSSVESLMRKKGIFSDNRQTLKSIGENCSLEQKDSKMKNIKVSGNKKPAGRRIGAFVVEAT